MGRHLGDVGCEDAMSLDDVVPADGIRVVTLPSGREVKFVYGQGRWMLE